MKPCQEILPSASFPTSLDLTLFDARLSTPLVIHVRGANGELDHPVKVIIAGFPATHW
jgi:hypothetical protein